jgi:hypothetical protein
MARKDDGSEDGCGERSEDGGVSRDARGAVGAALEPTKELQTDIRRNSDPTVTRFVGLGEYCSSFSRNRFLGDGVSGLYSYGVEGDEIFEDTEMPT